MVSLLPPNATTLQRNLADACTFDPLGPIADGVKTVSWLRPGAYSPYLAAQWRLAEFAGYFPSSEALITAGLPWLRTRGTAAAVTRALSWIGMQASIEEDGARLHIDPGTSAITLNLGKIKQLITASIPAHVHLYRLHHDYDIRAMRADHSRWDDAIWDDDSGEWVDGVKISTSTRITGAVAVQRRISSIHGITMLRRVKPDANAWDRAIYDQPMRLMDAGSTLSHSVSGSVQAPVRRCIGMITHAATGSVTRSVQVTGQKIDTLTRSIPSAHPRRKWRGQWVGTWITPVSGKLTQDGG